MHMYTHTHTHTLCTLTHVHIYVQHTCTCTPTLTALLQTMIEATVDVKTTDGYWLRMFCMGFTRRQPNQIKKTSYAKASQVRNIRKRMVEIIGREIAQSDLKEVVSKL